MSFLVVKRRLDDCRELGFRKYSVTDASQFLFYENYIDLRMRLPVTCVASLSCFRTFRLHLIGHIPITAFLLADKWKNLNIQFELCSLFALPEVLPAQAVEQKVDSEVREEEEPGYVLSQYDGLRMLRRVHLNVKVQFRSSFRLWDYKKLTTTWNATIRRV